MGGSQIWKKRANSTSKREVLEVGQNYKMRSEGLGSGIGILLEEATNRACLLRLKICWWETTVRVRVPLSALRRLVKVLQIS
jgi:hypothetical protein